MRLYFRMSLLQDIFTLSTVWKQFLACSMLTASKLPLLGCRAAAGRLQGLDDQLKGLKVHQEELGTQWNAEKDQMRSLQNIKEEIDRVNIEIQGAERDYDLNRAAELKYGTLLELQNKLNDTEKHLESQVGLSDSPVCRSWETRNAARKIGSDSLFTPSFPLLSFSMH